MTTPSIYFCTTCKGRAQHIELTLPANLRGNPLAHFVLLNYNSPDHLEEYLRTTPDPYVRGALESGRLSVYRFTEPGPFRMAHAKNMAHRLALREGADILVNMDADNYAGAGFDQYVANALTVADGAVGGPGHLSRDFLWAHMRKGEMRRGISGRIAVTKHAFLAAGGYDEVYHEWGPDDKDFNVRLRRLGFEAKEIDPKFLSAVSHNDKMRFREYPHRKHAPVVEDFVLPGREHMRIANMTLRGLSVGEGVVYKMGPSGEPGREPLEIGPLPTRIFGIGMQKTATNSLNRALIELGYDSAHWKSAHWAKAIWEEMQAGGGAGGHAGTGTHAGSPTLERSYALCDLPIPLLYKELDAAYPGAKFILTVRDEDEWLESVRKHFSSKNPFRAQWDTDPFTHRVHLEMYGRKKFDEQIMRERYRRHNAEVQEYFSGRSVGGRSVGQSSDLLVMDMSAGAGWYALCGFLRADIPSMAYPVEYRSGSVGA